jgi:hypothetical protein
LLPVVSRRKGSNPVRRATLRVKPPRPALANVSQRPGGCKLEIKLAGIGQQWLEVERAMGIEPTWTVLP